MCNIFKGTRWLDLLVVYSSVVICMHGSHNAQDMLAETVGWHCVTLPLSRNLELIFFFSFLFFSARLAGQQAPLTFLCRPKPVLELQVCAAGFLPGCCGSKLRSSCCVWLYVNTMLFCHLKATLKLVPHGYRRTTDYSVDSV